MGGTFLLYLKDSYDSFHRETSKEMSSVCLDKFFIVMIHCVQYNALEFTVKYVLVIKL